MAETEHGWSVFIGRNKDAETLCLIRSDDIETNSIAKARGFDFSNWQNDLDQFTFGPQYDSKYGSCWRYCNRYRLFKDQLEFDLKKIAQLEWVTILDENGNDIRHEYLESKERLTMESVKKLVDAGLMGVKLAGAGRAQEAAYSRLTELAVSRCNVDREVMEDPKVKALLLGTLPFVMHSMASIFEGHIPHAEHVKEMCELGMTETARTNSDKAIEIAQDLFSSMFMSMVKPDAVATADGQVSGLGLRFAMGEDETTEETEHSLVEDILNEEDKATKVAEASV